MERKTNQTTWWDILAIIVVCLLVGVVGARAQNYENADSLNVIPYNDSLLQLYGQFNADNGASTAAVSEPLDTATIVNYLFNIAVQANAGIAQGHLILMQQRRVNQATADISDLLVLYTGKTYRQLSEERFIANLAPCDTANVCRGFYTFKQTGQVNKILRIRSTGAVREVNAQGQQVAGGITGTIRFYAGTLLMGVNITAGPADLLNKELIFTNVEATPNGRQRWRTNDRVFSLTQRLRLGDTGASILNNK